MRRGLLLLAMLVCGLGPGATARAQAASSPAAPPVIAPSSIASSSIASAATVRTQTETPRAAAQVAAPPAPAATPLPTATAPAPDTSTAPAPSVAPPPVSAAPGVASPARPILSGLLSPDAASSAAVVAGPHAQTSEVVRLALALSLAALVPAIVLCMTPFVRLVVVLSMIRHGLGMPETPPNQVLVSLALFLTAFTMAPTLSAVNNQALTPFLEGRIAVERAMDQGAAPLRDFMSRQVRDQDLKAVYDIARQPLPARAREVGTLHLTSAFMLNELRVAFKIGFVVLLPFLLIDLVVSSVLLALGMMMVPPSSIALPIKVLLFVLIDGWSLVLGGVVGSFR